MERNAENGSKERGSHWRIAAWAVAALVLLLPLVAMQFTDEVNWGVLDFVLAGALLIGAGSIYELVVRTKGNATYRAAVAVALAAAFILVWVSLGVGIIGKDGDPANLMYVGVLAVGLTGAAIARLRPAGMARTLLAMAIAQVVVAVIALVAGFGSTVPLWWLDILGLTGFFAALWLLSAWLFRQAARSK